METAKTPFYGIISIDARGGISRGDRIPWHRTPAGREDLKHFKAMTIAGGVVIMGRKTLDAMGGPLPDRFNIVVSRTLRPGMRVMSAALPVGKDGVTSETTVAVVTTDTLDEALRIGAAVPRSKRIYVIGGAELLTEALAHPDCCGVYTTIIPLDFGCDVAVPELLQSTSHMVALSSSGSSMYRYSDLVSVRSADTSMDEGENVVAGADGSEARYLALMAEIAALPPRPNRTGVPAASSFARRLEFDLCRDDNVAIIPLLTTKFVSWKSVVVELLWFLRGCRGDGDEHNTSYLERHGVKIWRGNTSREYLDGIGMTDQSEGYTGPIYGAQWRGSSTKYLARPIDDAPRADQLAAVVKSLLTDPFGRRHLVSAWNVEDLSEMVLPPCHYSFQFHIDEKLSGRLLNCIVNMRSADMFLGVPFNIASYALLTHIVAALVGVTAGRLVLSMADCHVYETHLAAVAEQCARLPGAYPRLHLPDAATLDEFAAADPAEFMLINYFCHEAISAPMA